LVEFTPWQLPRVAPIVVGRSDLLSRLNGLLLANGSRHPAPVVALHGMAGVGKTTLAACWGWRHQQDFPGGGLFINCHGYSPHQPLTADDIIIRLLDGLGLEPTGLPATARQRADRLNWALSSRRTLLVLDNIENCTQARPVLAALLACPILVTSRATLTGLVVRDAVTSVAVPPLPMTDSAALLRSDIGTARSDGDSASVAALAAASGGLPMAVKLVGHYTAARPRARLSDIARELEDCTALLAATGHDDEQNTLQGAFALSFRALPAAAAELFTLLGLHPRPGFGRHTASALLGRPLADTERLLKILAEVHLLEPEGAHRYRVHDLLHAYSRSQAEHDLSADSRLRAVTRLADFYCKSTANAWSRISPRGDPVPELPDATDVTPVTFDSDRAALAWCGKERGNLIAMTHLAAAYQLHAHAWVIPALTVRIYERASGFGNDLLGAVQVAIDSARFIGNRDGEIGMLNYLGGSFIIRHTYRRALTLFNEAYAVAESSGHRQGISISLHNMAGAHRRLGESGTAARLYQQALQLKREMGQAGGIAHCLHGLAQTCRQQGLPVQALELFQQALQIRQHINDFVGLGDTFTELAALYHQQGSLDQARQHCETAMRMHDRTHNTSRKVETLTILARTHHDAGTFRESIGYAQRAADLCQATRDPLALARALHVLGRAQQASGDHHGAQATLARAEQIFAATDDPEADAVRTGIRRLGHAGHRQYPL
jgi:tetratricopeptide (TPR) repeat protein